MPGLFFISFRYMIFFLTWVYLVIEITFVIICSSVDEAAKEKFGPFSTLSSEESYQNRDLEKVGYGC